MVKLLFHSDIDFLDEWLPPLKKLIPELDAKVSSEISDPESVDIALIWKVPPEMEKYRNIKAVLSLGAGIDQLDLRALPAHVPLARLKDPSLTEGMKAYCRFAVLRYHRDFHLYEIYSIEGGPWRFDLPKPAAERRIGVLGLGELGAAVASDLTLAGFLVAGWSRTPKQIPEIGSYSGLNGLYDLASASEILINLLPLTPETEGILDKRLFAAMPKASYLINVGRGRHLVEADLIAALNSGHLAGATLDVFQKEPLPADHAFWRDPRILITPHVATAGNPQTASPQVAENIRRALRGDRLLNQVDLARGY